MALERGDSLTKFGDGATWHSPGTLWGFAHPVIMGESQPSPM